MTQHAELSAERWHRFPLEQQILMIANELHRGTKLMAPSDRDSLRLVYERVLRLTDLTVMVQSRSGLRREMLRWRDLVAALYIAPEADPNAHRTVLRCLLLTTPQSARQIPFVCP